MWQEAGADSSNRGILLLASTLSLCFFIYKAWGPLLFISFALVAVVHTCYSLVVNDSLFDRRTLHLLRYAGLLGIEILHTVRLLAVLGFRSLWQFVLYLKNRYYKKNRSPDDMSNRRSNVYRLSTPDLGENLTPGGTNAYNFLAMNGACNVARTSTPIPRGSNLRKEIHQNGGYGLSVPMSSTPVRKPQHYNENKLPPSPQMRNDPTVYVHRTQSWSGGMSPKMRDGHMSNKAVQNIAGPLLASTRFNIDPKIYSDINSPGLASRITKYASETNTRLTHQPQYATGQFPKVNLNAGSAPVLSPRVARARMPVTVRVAPPEMVNYTPPDNHYIPERPNVLVHTSDLKESKSCPSVSQVLKEISLKRHASREDLMTEMVKKQRTDDQFFLQYARSEDQLENLEEMMQKRARDDSGTSEEDLSPQSRTQRPSKRSKSSSCHDVLSSLSSSVHVLSGVKRKAVDTSRCNTPDVDKHFKSSSSQSSSSLFEDSREPVRSKEQLNVIVPVGSKSEPTKHTSKENDTQSPQPNRISPVREKSNSPKAMDQPTPRVHKEISNLPKLPMKPEKLTDKLFMKAEPEANEKLKNVIQEQENADSVFTSEGKDEIKKEDIVNMRQNSMRLRLQNMFDAISGKSANKIDPDVVIQAEEINPPKTSGYASLNSLTTTTTVNSSPITTTIVPILKNQDTGKSPVKKHVTFDLPSGSSSFSSTTSTTSVTSGTAPDGGIKPVASVASNFMIPNVTASTATSAPTINFSSGNNASNTSSTSGFKFTPSTSTTVLAPSKSAEPAPATTSTNFLGPKSTASNITVASAVSTSGFSFGIANTSGSATSTTLSTTPVSSIVSSASQAPSPALSAPAFNISNTLSKSPATTSMAPASNTLANLSSEKKVGFSFGSTAPAPAATSASNAQQVTAVFGASSATTTSSTQQAPAVFGASSASPMFSSGTSTASSKAPVATPSFSFGAPNKTAPASNSGFSFGNTNASSTTPNTAISTPAFSQTAAASSSNSGSGAFGSPATANPNNSFNAKASTPLFGAPTNSPNLFNNSASSPMFKGAASTAATTAPSIFGSQTSSSSFGTPSASTPSLFGNNNPVTTTSSGTPNLFGNSASTPSATTPSIFGNASANTSATGGSSLPSVFGNTAASSAASPGLSAFGSSSAQQQQTPQGNIFSGLSSTSNAAPSIFGSASNTPSGFPSGNAAQSNTVSAANTTESSNIFGQTKSPALAFGASSSPFGGSTNLNSSFSTPASNSGSAFQIGGASAPAASSSGGLPSFGSIKPSTQFGAPTTQQSSTSGSIFGSPSGTPAFGSGGNSAFGGFGSSNAAPAFGSGTSAPAFGSSAPASTTSFGGSASGFGAPASSTSPFGSGQTTTSAPTLFGNTAPVASTGAAASFSFGGASSQPQQQQQLQQPAASFSFGGATAAPAPSSGVFQFGASSAAPKQGGFNFSAPTGAPSINFTGSATTSFNAPPPGNLFSMGSGSSTPRSRTSRSRRPR